jgi:CPA2 family monovalent cation:H+ antiporter-2
MKWIASTKSNELFLFTVALLCLGMSALTEKAELSMALGAFMAGMILASSPYAYQAIGSFMPMRDIFTSLFFVTIGLKMDVGELVEKPFLTIGLAVGIMAINTLSATVAMKLTGLTNRVSVLIGFSLCQIGEFAFVLSAKGSEVGLFSEEDLAVFLNVAVLTMAMTPLALALARYLSNKMGGTDKGETKGPSMELSGHAIVVGFGVAGQGVARACRLTDKKYAVVDMNPKSVAAFQKLGEPIIFGDAVGEHVLEHVGIHRAAMLVVSIPDPLAARRIIAQAKSLNPDIYIICRTRFLLSKDGLIRLGADAVVAEEFEAALEVFDSVLSHFQASPEERVKHLADAREAGPARFREPNESQPPHA